MNNQNQINAQQDEDSISLWQVLDFFKDGWRWLVSGLLVGIAGALGFLLWAPVLYEATAIVAPATVGMSTVVSTSATSTKGSEVESVGQTLERLKFPTFYTSELLKSCEALSGQALAAGVKATLVKGNSLIQVSYRAPSVDVAEGCVNAIVAQLIKSQVSIAAPVIKTLEEQLALTKRQLVEAEAFQGQLEKRTVTSTDGASLLMLNALSKREEIVRLHKLLIEQQVQLTSPLTQQMQLLEPIYAPEKPVAPKRLPVLVGGLFGGLALGCLIYFLRRSWLDRKAV